MEEVDLADLPEPEALAVLLLLLVTVASSLGNESVFRLRFREGYSIEVSAACGSSPCSRRGVSSSTEGPAVLVFATVAATTRPRVSLAPVAAGFLLSASLFAVAPLPPVSGSFRA